MSRVNLTGDFVCCRCNKHFPNTNKFRPTRSPLFKGTGFLPICEDCMEVLFNEYAIMYNDRKKAMKRICMYFDIYYNDSIFAKVVETEGKVVSRYIRQTQMKQYKDKLLDDSLKEGFVWDEQRQKLLISQASNPIDMTKYIPDAEIEVVSDKDIEKWGPGFDNNDYKILNSHYKYLKDANPNCDSNQEIFILDLCYTKMQQLKSSRESRIEDFNKLTKLYTEQFKQAGLKTVQENNTTEEFTFAVNGEVIEKYSPAEFYKNQKRYKDFDGLGDYIRRNFFRPMKNLMTGSKDEDPEYHVKDDNEAVENGFE